MATILVTGGAGYIGSHTCVELLLAGHSVFVVDNFSNSHHIALTRVEQITGQLFEYREADIRDESAMRAIFETHAFDAVVHFAGLKAVGESVAQPLRYFDNNIQGTLVLARLMQEFGVSNLVFSSSATVYGDPHSVPITEDFPLGATNPYGRSKWVIEQMLQDLCVANPDWHVALLRYFNPVGAHESGLIGEDPSDIPNNLMPYIAQVAVGKLAQLSVFGGDYPTHDGTGVRDYIHVVDLAKGHVKALNKLYSTPGIAVYNLGTGKGYSVLDMVAAFERASGKKIPYEIVERRPGDAAICYADPARAKLELDWSAELDIDAMTADAWRWQHNNPNGYKSS